MEQRGAVKLVFVSTYMRFQLIMDWEDTNIKTVCDHLDINELITDIKGGCSSSKETLASFTINGKKVELQILLTTDKDEFLLTEEFEE